MPLFVRF